MLKKLDLYIKNPTVTNIHDMRVAIRRFNATSQMLPKRIRKDSAVDNYILQTKELFKINTKIRDLDIIYGKLEKFHQDVVIKNLLISLKQERNNKLLQASTTAKKFFDLKVPKINENYFPSSKLEKRFLKVVSDLSNKIKNNFPIVTSDESKIEELHVLRKDLKRLRYSLELININKKTRFLLANLKSMQEMLGKIHDNDMVVNYLHGIKGANEIGDVLNSEIENRKNNYKKFVKIFKNKLKIEI